MPCSSDYLQIIESDHLVANLKSAQQNNVCIAPSLFSTIFTKVAMYHLPTVPLAYV